MQQVSGKQQLSRPHQGTYESQLHSVLLDPFDFCLPAHPPAALEVWFTGLGSDLGQQSPAGSSHSSGACEGQSRLSLTVRAELRALQLLLMKWWQMAGDVVSHRRITSPAECVWTLRSCVNTGFVGGNKKVCFHWCSCSWVVLFMSPKRQPLPTCIIWLSLPIIPLAV